MKTTCPEEIREAVIFKITFIILNCVFVCMWVCACTNGYAGRLEVSVQGVCWWVRGIGSPGAEVTDGWTGLVSAMVVGN